MTRWPEVRSSVASATRATAARPISTSSCSGRRRPCRRHVPFVIDSFTYLGSLDTTLGIVPGPDAGGRTDELPLVLSVVGFPELPR